MFSRDLPKIRKKKVNLMYYISQKNVIYWNRIKKVDLWTFQNKRIIIIFQNLLFRLLFYSFHYVIHGTVVFGIQKKNSKICKCKPKYIN